MRLTRAKPSSWLRSRAGFTMVEMLVVLVLGSLVVVAVGGAIPGTRATARAKACARDVATALSRARAESIRTGEEQTVSFDLEGRSYAAGGGAPAAFPDGVEVRLLFADEERVGSHQGAIRFLPQGGSTGGRVEVRTDGGRSWAVDVSWLTGAVRWHEEG